MMILLILRRLIFLIRLIKKRGQTGDNGIKDVEVMVPLKYSSNFRRTLEMPLVNCEINLILTWSANCVIVSTDAVNQRCNIFNNYHKTLCSNSNVIISR